jgi:endonuclease I
MQSDMHNLFPKVGKVIGDRSNFIFGKIYGEERKYGECDFEVARNCRSKEIHQRGYCTFLFLHITSIQDEMSEDFEELLSGWHLSDPPGELVER